MASVHFPFLLLSYSKNELTPFFPFFPEVAGYGLTCDARHMTGLDEEGAGAARATTLALRGSRLQPRQVAYISAHVLAHAAGYDGHFANGLAALSLACGQDVANVVTSAGYWRGWSCRR
jgi:3-oxoacyl-(acyl-carrier-protein) synthase